MNMKSKSGIMLKMFVGIGLSTIIATTGAQAQISSDHAGKYQTKQNQTVIQNQNQEMPDVYRMRSAAPAASIDDESERPLLGVYVDETDYETAYKLHYENNYGARVEEVVPGGAADDAGLLRNDIIMEIDDTRVLYAEHLERLLQEKDPGEEISIKYFRDGRELSTTVTLQGQEQPERKPQRKRFRVFGGDVGDGGFSFSTGFYQPDHTELTSLIESLGFSDILSQPPVGTFDENGIVTSGFQIRFEGDNGWYWGFITN
ncbi:MAG: PDZ domain-containing protein, partial [Candidatus Marinimicrobia bacterium]|nr:PDZ domain-containing protein [Candidatus Neomarinimicrobiota bacterium]